MYSDIEFLQALSYKLRLTASLSKENSYKIEEIFHKVIVKNELNIVLRANANFSRFQFACYIDRFVNPAVVMANKFMIKAYPVMKVGLSVYALDNENQYRIVGRLLEQPSTSEAMCEIMYALAEILDQIAGSLAAADSSAPEETFFQHAFQGTDKVDNNETRAGIMAYFSAMTNNVPSVHTKAPYSLYRLISWIGSDIEYKAEKEIEEFYAELESQVNKEQNVFAYSTVTRP